VESIVMSDDEGTVVVIVDADSDDDESGDIESVGAVAIVEESDSQLSWFQIEPSILNLVMIGDDVSALLLQPLSLLSPLL